MQPPTMALAVIGDFLQASGRRFSQKSGWQSHTLASPHACIPHRESLDLAKCVTRIIAHCGLCSVASAFVTNRRFLRSWARGEAIWFSPGRSACFSWLPMALGGAVRVDPCHRGWGLMPRLMFKVGGGLDDLRSRLWNRSADVQ